MNAPTLPPEVVSIVFQKISAGTIPRHRRQTLYQSCLVCRDFRFISQPLLFSSLEFLNKKRGTLLVQTLKSSPWLAEFVQELHLPISTEDWRWGNLVPDILPLVKNARILGVKCDVMGRRRWCDLPTVVLSSLRAFWEGVQGKTLTHLTLARIGDFYFSELIVPNLQELNLVSFCSAGNDPGVKQRPKHHLRRLSFDFFQADTLFSGTSLHLFVQNSMQPLESLIFKFYSNPFAGLDLFSAIQQLLGPRMNALTHLQIDCPERYYRDGTLRTFSLPALASLRTLDLRIYKDDDHTQRFLNEWVTSQLNILPYGSPFSLLDIYLHEGYFSGLLGRFRRCGYNLPGLDQEICDSRRKIQVTFLKGSKTGHSIISQALRTQTKEFVEEALPLATLNQLVKVDITTVVSLSLNLEE